MRLERLLPEFNDDDLYRFHLAKKEPSGTRPLDALAKSREEWTKWQLFKGNGKDRFTKDRIVTFAQMHGDKFLFGGVFEILSRHQKVYKVVHTEDYSELIGRLIVQYDGLNKRATVFKPSYIYENTIIAGIHEHPFKGEPFVSYDEINHDFSALELIVRNNLSDWRVALSSVGGVYLISDKHSGKQYIGSAYGEHGLWQRWHSYVTTFHGRNEDLVDLFNGKSEKYFRDNFVFTTLEVIPLSRPVDEIKTKEALWKRKLFTRLHGYNKN